MNAGTCVCVSRLGLAPQSNVGRSNRRGDWTTCGAIQRKRSRTNKCDVYYLSGVKRQKFRGRLPVQTLSCVRSSLVEVDRRG